MYPVQAKLKLDLRCALIQTVWLAALALVPLARAQSSAFTYQGRLNAGGSAANGSYDLRFELFDAPTNGALQSPVLTNAAVAVSNGLFAVALDFGPGQFAGADRWLDIAVRAAGNGSDFIPLAPCQALTPSPYALYAANAGVAASASSVAAGNIQGMIPLTQLPATVLTNGASGVTLAGTFVGDGSGVTNVGLTSLRETFRVPFAWGFGQYGEDGVPGNLSNVVAIAAGWFHNLVLRADGTVVAWGFDGFGEVDVPAGLPPAVQVAAGRFHSLALLASGAVVQWGADLYSSGPPPGLGTAKAIAAGQFFSLALLTDGTVAAWGNNDQGQLNIPAGLSNVISVSAGVGHALALRSDGTVAGWGSLTVPAGLSNVVAIAAGSYHSLALKQDGTVIGWGSDMFGETEIPIGLSNVVALAGGDYFSVALLADGTVAEWGLVSSPPAGLKGGFAISAHYEHALALCQITGLAQPALLTEANVFQSSVAARSFIGNGAALTALNASSLASGTVSDARLSPNVALRAGGNSFSGTQTLVSGNLGVGTTNPVVLLHVSGSGEALTIGVDPHHGGYTALSGGVSAPKGGYAWLQGIRDSGTNYGDLVLNELGGNVGIGTPTPGARLEVAGEARATVFTPTSDRNAKEGFALVDVRSVLEKVLALPISQWSFKEFPGVRHLGPMAQDFHAAFDLGPDDKHIATVDADGVALAAIQGLHRMLEDRDAQIQSLRLENQSLGRRLEALEKLAVSKAK